MFPFVAPALEALASGTFLLGLRTLGLPCARRLRMCKGRRRWRPVLEMPMGIQ